MAQRLINFVNHRWAFSVFFFLLVTALSLHKYFTDTPNNFLIMRFSFFNLLANVDLYAAHPAQHFDHFKYSPTFALFYAPMSILPWAMGAVVWNLVNSMFFLHALYLMRLEAKKRAIIIAICLVELVTSLQNFQSNGLVLALFLYSFVALERGANQWGALATIGNTFVKVFGIVGAAIFWLYDQKIKSILYAIGWALLLFLLPMLITGPEQLIRQYKSWGQLLAGDTVAYGISVMGILHVWLGLQFKVIIVQLAGALALLSVLLYRDRYQDYMFRLRFLGLVLLWVVLFNHKAESPTFIIAMMGVAIWYLTAERNIIDHVLLGFCILFTSLSPTDVFPPYIRIEFVKPYHLKALPCIFIFLRLLITMHMQKPAAEPG